MRSALWLIVVAFALGAVLAAGSWAHAQPPGVPVPQPQATTVISGNDIGFRVDSRKGNTPVGTLVVRINGQWVEAEFASGVKRLTAK
jgi:hypothetical protein